MNTLKIALAAATIAASAAAMINPVSAKGFGGMQAPGTQSGVGGMHAPGTITGAGGLKAPGSPSPLNGIRYTNPIAKPFPGGGLPHPHNPGPFPPGGWHHGGHWNQGGSWGGGYWGQSYIGVGLANFGDCEIVRKRVIDEYGNVFIRRVRVCG